MKQFPSNTEETAYRKYEQRLALLKSTFSREQEALFNDWFDAAITVHSFAVAENRASGFNAGLELAKELFAIDDKPL